MTWPLLNVFASTPPDLALPPDINANPVAADVPAPSALFAELLHTAAHVDTPAHDALPLVDTASEPLAEAVADIDLSLPKQTPRTDEDALDDHAWPPVGLASLWLITPPESPQAHSTVPASMLPAPAQANVSANVSAAAPTDTLDAPAPAPAPASASALASPTGVETLTNGVELAAAAPAPEVQLPSAGPAPFSLREPAAALSQPEGSEPLSRPGETGQPSELSTDSPPAAPLREAGAGSTSAEPASAQEITPGERPTPQILSPIPSPFPVPPPPAPTATSHVPLAQTPATPSSHLPVPDLYADNFTQTLGPHIQWLAGHKIEHAHIQLNPQELGPLEVHLELDGDQLQARFNSAHVDVRQALEHGLPHLRELLGEHGLHLAQSSISQHSSQQQRSSSPPPPAAGFMPAPADEDVAPPIASTQSSISHSLLDAYA